MRKLLVFVLLSAIISCLSAQNIYHADRSATDVSISANLIYNQAAYSLWVANEAPDHGARLLAENPWSNEKEVVLFDLSGNSASEVVQQVGDLGSVICTDPDYLLVSLNANNVVTLRNEVKAPMVRLKCGVSAGLRDELPPVDTNQLVYEIVAKVDTQNIIATIARLQAFTTRKATTDSAVAAAEWIRQQFENMGYTVELQEFTMGNTASSPNVLATKTGTTYPEKVVIIGGHYDSYTWSDEAPGADDNASGTAGVIEAARILADYPTECTIIFCAFSGEEYGLYGSAAFASRCKQQNMNILGYFNLDMIGYRNPGDAIHTDMIFPPSAKPLADYYQGIAAIFVPGLVVSEGFMISGDSDHTSFNNNGYMGIFPFEDDQNHSPYIHTVDDVLGLSVNSAEMAGMLTQASLAGVGSLGGVFSYVGLEENNGGLISSIIPNPARAQVRIIVQGFQTGQVVDLLSADGRRVLSMALPPDGLIAIDRLPAGVFIVKVSDGIRSAISKLIIN
ncbi:MAG: hypothetical protein CVU06_01040 [Bacteroidetes bacterium HGW-Bacteroidetes-22]|nr:MAG: hypothetical protein CVU06_01040 [Bacteroidetes bacterium HGW-Bacteroidetes-22]